MPRRVRGSSGSTSCCLLQVATRAGVPYPGRVDGLARCVLLVIRGQQMSSMACAGRWDRVPHDVLALQRNHAANVDFGRDAFGLGTGGVLIHNARFVASISPCCDCWVMHHHAAAHCPARRASAAAPPLAAALSLPHLCSKQPSRCTACTCAHRSTSPLVVEL